MSEWNAIWSGSYPNLCSGHWTLYKDGEKVDTEIPFQGYDANTYGEYSSWYFDDDWMDRWDYYYDGLECDKWCETYKDWLSTIASDDEWPDIYYAFNVEDWRSGCCGGCI